MAKTSTELASLARKHTAAAVNTLVGIMNQPKSPEAARVSAAKAIMDRGWGMPKQTIEADVTDDIKALLRAVDGATRTTAGD